MTHAYPEIYLNSAMGHLADMFDIAISDLDFDPDEFAALFSGSKLCRRMEIGEAACLLGKSGLELLSDVLEGSGLPQLEDREGFPSAFSRTPAYWAGWAAAYYQWLTGISFAELFAKLPFSTLLSLYPALHEAPVEKTAEVIGERLKTQTEQTNLCRIRRSYGCSQAKLARLSGVSLRSIQMYEQRGKDINKAQAETLLRLARALGCTMEDLIEPAFV